jgi:hypothetical protein
MDINAIKAKLAGMNRSQDREKIDYAKVFWNPGVGSYQIRIVPSMYNPTLPFTELFFHYNIGKYPMIALTNFGEQDPIVEFVAELKKTSDKDNWSLAGKLAPKMRIFAPVIVRGEEDMGVRLWSFGKVIQKTLFTLATDEEIGDYTDIINGRDLTVDKVAGNPYPETTVRPRIKESPLTKDNALAEKWLKEQPNPLECFTKYDYTFIKKQLQTWLNPEEAAEETATAPIAVTPVTAGPVTETQESTTPPAAKANKVMSDFSDLFD